MNKPLFHQTAGDLMTRELVLIPRDMSLKGAAQLLFRQRVTGAPVVDEKGRCVGVISATDFVRCASKESPHPERSHPVNEYCAEWSLNGDLENLPEEEVGAFMTRDPITVRLAAPVSTLARQMVDAHVHRLIVVDAEERPIGIVSSMDILAAVVRAGQPLAERQAATV